MRRRMTSARVKNPTTTPSRTTGKRSTSFELIRFATSASVWSSDRQHRARHRLFHQDETGISGGALQLTAGRRADLPRLGALQEVGNQVAQQLAMCHHADE